LPLLGYVQLLGLVSVDDSICPIASASVSAGDRQAKSKAWPQSPKGLGNIIKRLMPGFRKLGLSIDQSTGGITNRHYQIKKAGIYPYQAYQNQENDKYNNQNNALHGTDSKTLSVPKRTDGTDSDAVSVPIGTDSEIGTHTVRIENPKRTDKNPITAGDAEDLCAIGTLGTLKSEQFKKGGDGEPSAHQK
jgi:hypothetical protein